MRATAEIKIKAQGVSKRLANSCRHEGEFSARKLGEASRANCPCWGLYQIEKLAFEACIPKKFWSFSADDVTDNKSVFEGAVLNYLKRENLAIALRDGAGLFLTGPNGCGKSAFLSFILMELLRNTSATVYYTTSMRLDVDTKKTFGDKDERRRLDAYMNSNFVVIDELGKETYRSGDSFNRMTLESWLRWREENNKPTLLASNMSLSDLRKPVDEGGYGETIGSLIEGSYVTIPMEAVDVRRRKGAELQERMNY